MNEGHVTPLMVHIAVRTEKPSGLAEFYKNVFSMRFVLSQRAAVDLWDGQVFLALNPVSQTGGKGLEHFGFLVKDLPSLRVRLDEAGASKIAARPAGRSFTDWRVHDTEGNPIDISERGYSTIPAHVLEKPDDHSSPRIDRLVIISDDPPRLAKFYESAFAMKTVHPVPPVESLQVERQNAPDVSAGKNVLNFPEGTCSEATDVSLWYGVHRSPETIILTDGMVRLVLCARDGRSAKGLYCFGFGVGNPKEISERLEQMGVAIASEPDWGDKKKQCFYFRDPAGNLLEFHEIGD